MSEGVVPVETPLTIEQDVSPSYQLGALVIRQARRLVALGLAVALVAGCGDNGNELTREQRASIEASAATASAVDQYESQQAAGPEADNAGRKQMQAYVFGEGGLADSMVNDLEDGGNRFVYESPGYWRWSNAAADAGDSHQTAVFAQFADNVLTIEKQAVVNGKVVTVGVVCSLPNHASPPADANTKSEISNWITESGSEHLRVESLYSDVDPAEPVGEEIDSVAINATYVSNGDFESLSFAGAKTASHTEQFNELFGLITDRWESIAGKAA